MFAYNSQIITRTFRENSSYSTNDEDEVIQLEKKVIPDQSKYKTELCKEFQLNNFCKYDYKCKFAHGKEELVIKQGNEKFKSKKCKQYHENGYCRYGLRCQFQHEQRKLIQIQQQSYFTKKLLNIDMFNVLQNQQTIDRLSIFQGFQNLQIKKKITNIID